MNQCRLLWRFGLWMLLAATGGNVVAAGDDLAAALQGRYGELKKAMETANVQGAGELLSADFVSVTVDGKTRTRDEYLRQVNAPANREREVTLVSVKREGDAAIVNLRSRAAMHPPSQDGKDHVLEVVALLTDSWVVEHGQWKLRKSVAERVSTSWDGQSQVTTERKQNAPAAQGQ